MKKLRIKNSIVLTVSLVLTITFLVYGIILYVLRNYILRGDEKTGLNFDLLFQNIEYLRKCTIFYFFTMICFVLILSKRSVLNAKGALISVLLLFLFSLFSWLT